MTLKDYDARNGTNSFLVFGGLLIAMVGGIIRVQSLNPHSWIYTMFLLIGLILILGGWYGGEL